MTGFPFGYRIAPITSTTHARPMPSPPSPTATPSCSYRGRRGRRTGGWTPLSGKNFGTTTRPRPISTTSILIDRMLQVCRRFRLLCLDLRTIRSPPSLLVLLRGFPIKTITNHAYRKDPGSEIRSANDGKLSHMCMLIADQYRNMHYYMADIEHTILTGMQFQRYCCLAMRNATISS